MTTCFSITSRMDTGSLIRLSPAKWQTHWRKYLIRFRFPVKPGNGFIPSASSSRGGIREFSCLWTLKPFVKVGSSIILNDLALNLNKLPRWIFWFLVHVSTDLLRCNARKSRSDSRAGLAKNEHWKRSTPIAYYPVNQILNRMATFWNRFAIDQFIPIPIIQKSDRAILVGV